MHHRVADDRDLQDIGQLDAGLFRDAFRQAVESAAHRLGHLEMPARVHHDIGDAAHQILAVADLRVHHAVRGQHLAGFEIAEMDRHGGRADVVGETVDLLFEAGENGEQPLLLAHGHRGLPLAVAQRLLDFLQDPQVGDQTGDAPLALQGLLQAPQVARRIVHVGLGHLDVVQLDLGVDLDVAHVGTLAHHLLVDLALRRHVDNEVAQDSGLAGQTPPLYQAPLVGVALLRLANLRGVGEAGRDAVLGKLPLFQPHLAAAADRAPTADGINVDAERAGCVQQRRAQREVPSLAGGQEDNQGVRRHRPCS